MLPSDAAVGNRPVNVADVISVELLSRKSSAASISTPVPAGRDAAPSRPSGDPVVKLNALAPTKPAVSKDIARAIQLREFMNPPLPDATVPLLDTIRI